MKKIKLHGKKGTGLYLLVDEADFDIVSPFSWFLGSHGYACSKQNTVLAHRLILDNPSGKEIDHINGDKLDCRRTNLRIVTRQQNSLNKAKHKDNTSGYKGVHWFKRDKKWQAQICNAGKRYHLGYYKDIREAAKAYNNAAKKLHGNYAILNEVV